MKKIILNICMAVFTIVLASSCSDKFLEEVGPVGKFTDDIFQSEDQTTWLIADIYYDFYHGYNSPKLTVLGTWSDDYHNMTEEQGGNIESWIQSGTTYEDATYGSAYYGSQLTRSNSNDPYTRIRFCHMVIEKIEEIGPGNLSESFMQYAKGQMYYLAALQYFDLMRTYGGVPLVTEVQNATNSDESIKLPRATTSEVVDLIVSYLDKAAEMLPRNWENASSDYGRPVAGAALANKARVLVTFASPLFNPDWDTDKTRWETALAACSAAETELTAAGYGLYGSTASDWEDMFLIDNSFCSEAIFTRLLSSGDSDEQNSWENSIRLTSQGGGGGISVPKEMIDLFPMANGDRPTVSNGYDEFLFFKERDPRFYRTFSFTGAMWNYEAAEDTVWAYSWVNGTNRSYSENNDNISPVFVRKMSDPKADNEGFAASGTDIFEYRYAELVLDLAECYAALGQTQSCIENLSRIRSRVGITSANNYGLGTFSDKYEAIEACLYERRVELAYEGKRFYDIHRWMLYDDDQTINSGNNTCAKLGLDPLNGTARHGFYLQYNVSASEDPLEILREDVGVNIDASTSDFENQIDALADFYTANFVMAELDDPMDISNGEENLISWQSNYYIKGLKASILSQNPWLEQTIGWKDYYGSDGTFNYLSE